ncbi:hypothetical protein MHU86_19405 [Fragilaria crotonensis]|nr:hypothetical protein MHU86_19405 [Fragilaria crotonensis]
MLERSHVSIPDADALEIAERIAECLRTQSITASFDDNKAVAETACHTQFYIKLFEDDHQLIVEVQRRTGCSYTFHQCSKAVLRAAKGKNHVVVNLVKLSENVPLGDQLTIIINLVLMRPDEDDSFATMLRRDALTVLANSLALSHPADLVSDELIRTLIADLTDNDLHTAHQAARCLTSVCQCKGLKQLVAKMGATSATLRAQQEGHSRHEMLERETRLLQMELEG